MNPTSSACEGGCGKPRHSCTCTPTRWCKNCKHYLREEREDWCASPKLNGISLVTGKRELSRASAMRLDIVTELRCGTIARFYEAHPPKPTPPALRWWQLHKLY